MLVRRQREGNPPALLAGTAVAEPRSEGLARCVPQGAVLRSAVQARQERTLGGEITLNAAGDRGDGYDLNERAQDGSSNPNDRTSSGHFDHSEAPRCSRGWMRARRTRVADRSVETPATLSLAGQIGRIACALLAMGCPALLFAQNTGGPLDGILPNPGAVGAGGVFEHDWLQFAWLAGSLVSGTLLGYHPHYRGRVGNLDELDLPKIFITYTVIGALVAVIVQQNPYMGAAVFGLGGLMRFRTLLSSAKETGRLIFATMIGIAWGVGAWPMALAMTSLAWILVFILDWSVAYRIVVRRLEGSLDDSVAAYREVLESFRCAITQIKQNPNKAQVTFVFKASRNHSKDALQEAFDEEIPDELRGSVDWSEEG
jgi:hypothetical protein